MLPLPNLGEGLGVRASFTARQKHGDFITMPNAPEWAALQLRLREQIKQTVCKYQEAYPKPIVEEAADMHGGENLDSTTILLPYIAYARWAGDSATRAWLYEWRD